MLVIDGDMRSPAIHRVFQIDRDPGLAAVLAEKCKLADAIVATWSDRVHFLPAGKLTGNPLGLLADGGMAGSARADSGRLPLRGRRHAAGPGRQRGAGARQGGRRDADLHDARSQPHRTGAHGPIAA